MTEAKSLGPVSLPAGSYDGEALAKGLEKAIDRKPENQQAEVAKAVENARENDTTRNDPALLPDHVFVDLDNLHGGTERRQVFSPELADRHRVSLQPVTPALATDVADADEVEKANAAAIKQAVADTKPTKAEKAAGPPVIEESRTGAADPELSEEATTRPSLTEPADETTARSGK